MELSDTLRKILVAFGSVLAVWVGIKYVFPVLLPFLMGLLLALAAEPAVGFIAGKGKLPRSVSAGIGVMLTLLFLAAAVSLLGALAVKELGKLTGTLPAVADKVQQGMTLLQDQMVTAAQKLPEGAENLVSSTVLTVFDDGNLLLQQMTQRLPGAVGSVLGWLPNGALGLGTAILAAFMISARLPKLRQWAGDRIPTAWKEKYLPPLRRVRHSLESWLKAQGKLVAVTYCIVTTGFILLGVRYGFVWALLVALVDAVPILGTGVILVPWGAVLMLQGETIKGFGIMGVWAASLLTRTILEPRLVGKHLGLDPLLTLLFLYVGYRFWGILGMIFAPMLAAAGKSILTER